MQTQDLDRLARRRAKAKLAFYVHAAVFIAANLALFFINGQLTPSYKWHVWPLGGWAIGLAFHGLGVFFLGAGSALRQRMVEHERRLLDDQAR